MSLRTAANFMNCSHFLTINHTSTRYLNVRVKLVISTRKLSSTSKPNNIIKTIKQYNNSKSLKTVTEYTYDGSKIVSTTKQQPSQSNSNFDTNNNSNSDSSNTYNNLSNADHRTIAKSNINARIKSILSSLLFRIIQPFLPKSYPTSVKAGYYQFVCYQMLGMIFSTAGGVLSMQSLLYAIGLNGMIEQQYQQGIVNSEVQSPVLSTQSQATTIDGIDSTHSSSPVRSSSTSTVDSNTPSSSVAAVSTIPLAATLNWIIKDGIGQIGGVFFASMINTSFDTNPKKWRMISILTMDFSSFLEVLIPLFPSSFLLIASIANIGKNIAFLSASASRAAIHKSFAQHENLADITAKTTSQSIFSSTIGTFLGMALSTIVYNHIYGMIGMYLLCSFMNILCTYQSLKYVTINILDQHRLDCLLHDYFSKVDILSIISKMNSSKNKNGKDYAVADIQQSKISNSNNNSIQSKDSSYSTNSVSNSKSKSPNHSFDHDKLYSNGNINKRIITPSQLRDQETIFLSPPALIYSRSRINDNASDSSGSNTVFTNRSDGSSDYYDNNSKSRNNVDISGNNINNNSNRKYNHFPSLSVGASISEAIPAETDINALFKVFEKTQYIINYINDNNNNSDDISNNCINVTRPQQVPVTAIKDQYHQQQQCVYENDKLNSTTTVRKFFEFPLMRRKEQINPVYLLFKTNHDSDNDNYESIDCLLQGFIHAYFVRLFLSQYYEHQEYYYHQLHHRHAAVLGVENGSSIIAPNTNSYTKHKKIFNYNYNNDSDKCFMDGMSKLYSMSSDQLKQLVLDSTSQFFHYSSSNSDSGNDYDGNNKGTTVDDIYKMQQLTKSFCDELNLLTTHSDSNSHSSSNNSRNINTDKETLHDYINNSTNDNSIANKPINNSGSNHHHHHHHHHTQSINEKWVLDAMILEPICNRIDIN